MTLTAQRRSELLARFDALLTKGVHSVEDARAIHAVVDELIAAGGPPALPSRPDAAHEAVAGLDLALREGRWPTTVEGLTAASRLAHACARAASTGQARRLWQVRARGLDARLHRLTGQGTP
ncbi:hypothetical protein Cch01nite_31780 [Cellulomonas chitinilytica]|uniref:Uncharacterized protein n=1 Tax=Cellulomonas chitinilytica TaxID=398759 RepID=A0A919P7N3_9CELL|nr:hypothetical protein [Cellulomonas chitinilytica]GIG22454.1 hypothetical protein Cch01nite_31780 [Cellulomonas chitinilytica]